MGAVGGGQKRSGRQITLITSEGYPGFGIEVDELLRAGDSGFLGESDAGDAELTGCRQNQKASNVSFFFYTEKKNDLFWTESFFWLWELLWQSIIQILSYLMVQF